MKRIGIVLAGVFACLAPLVARADMDAMLLWMVYDNYNPPRIDDNGTLKYIDQLGSDGARVNGAKLRVDGGDYLDIYSTKGHTMFPNAMLTINLDNLAVLGQIGPVWSNLGDYADASYAFIVELGHWEGNEWTVMATSKATSYAELLGSGWTASDMDAYPREGPWKPEFSVKPVPEPTSGLMLLLGTALLALRRRKPQADGCAA